MSKLATPIDQAHRKSVQTPLQNIATFLEENLGPNLLAFMVGVNPKTIKRWTQSEPNPAASSEEKLRGIHQVFQMLISEEAPQTVRAWFVGRNPQLDDESPATAIREDRLRDVFVAARSFLAGG